MGVSTDAGAASAEESSTESPKFCNGGSGRRANFGAAPRARKSRWSAKKRRKYSWGANSGWSGKGITVTDAAERHAATGVAGLDDILRGGFPRDRLFLIAGTPGTGKTTLAMQFLLAGIAPGETCLYVTLSETTEEISNVARSHGWDLSKLRIAELVPSENNLSADSQITVSNPSERELGETTEALIAAANTHRPQRLVIVSLSGLRLIAQHSLRYRSEIFVLL